MGWEDQDRSYSWTSKSLYRPAAVKGFRDRWDR